jgi:hypothetical protein
MTACITVTYCTALLTVIVIYAARSTVVQPLNDRWEQWGSLLMYMGSPTDSGAGATVSVLLALHDDYEFAG